MATYIFDMDGVLADLHAVWLRKYTEQTGHVVRKENLPNWRVDKVMNKLPISGVVQIVRDPRVYWEVEPIPGAVEIFVALKEEGHRCLVASDTYSTMFGAKVDWLIHHGFMYSRQDFLAVPSRHKPLLRCDALIEDNYETAAKHTNGIVFNQPWTRAMRGVLPFIEDWREQERVRDVLQYHTVYA